VICTNKERGCEWQGELNDIINHLGNSDGCQFEDVKCFNECGNILQRQHLTSHAKTECPCRMVDCQYCHITKEHQYIKGEHKEQCPKFPLPCPNNCGTECILRENMEDHRKECLFEIIKCSNNCGKTLERQYLTSHVQMECPCRVDECQFCHNPGEHQFIRSLRHRRVCPKLPLPCPNKCEVGSVPREDMDAHRKECPLEIVQCEYHNVGCEERMIRKDLEKHMKENVEDHLVLVKEDAAQAKKQLRQIKGKMELLQRGVIEATDDLVECIAMQPSYPVVPVIVRMAGFSGYKKQNKLWTSPKFGAHIDNTSVTMCLYVYPNGCAESQEKQMSVELHVTFGGREVCAFPKTQFNVSLLSQTNQTNSHVVLLRGNLMFYMSQGTSSSIFEGWHTKFAICPAFLSHKRLQTNSQFLQGDCLYFKVSYHEE